MLSGSAVEVVGGRNGGLTGAKTGIGKAMKKTPGSRAGISGRNTQLGVGAAKGLASNTPNKRGGSATGKGFGGTGRL